MLLTKTSVQLKLKLKRENVAIANALQLETTRRRASRSGLFLANFYRAACNADAVL